MCIMWQSQVESKYYSVMYFEVYLYGGGGGKFPPRPTTYIYQADKVFSMDLISSLETGKFSWEGLGPCHLMPETGRPGCNRNGFLSSHKV